MTLMPSSEQAPSPNPIAERNDDFRRTTREILLTIGAQALRDVPGLIGAVRTFDSFTPDNDPYGEHDFGAIDWHTERTYWKIDYYDKTLSGWEDPLSAACRRMLTVMLASEY